MKNYSPKGCKKMCPKSRTMGRIGKNEGQFYDTPDGVDSGSEV